MGSIPEKVEPYEAKISEEILERWNNCIRVWDKPESAVAGADVLDMITQPAKVTVTEVQKDMMYATTPQRYKITYGDKQGWVLADMVAAS